MILVMLIQNAWYQGFISHYFPTWWVWIKGKAMSIKT